MKLLVVARYKEDDTWVRGISFPHVIYNKHYDEGHRLRNVGREANTYLQHIISNYDDLPSTTIFCQGDPFAHAKRFCETIEALPSRIDAFCDLSDFSCVCDDVGAPDHAGLRVGDDFTAIFGRPSPGRFLFGAGAQFAVPREVIRSRPLSFYLGLYQRTLTDEPAYPFGFVIERLWPLIFSADP